MLGLTPTEKNILLTNLVDPKQILLHLLLFKNRCLNMVIVLNTHLSGTKLKEGISVGNIKFVKLCSIQTLKQQWVHRKRRHEYYLKKLRLSFFDNVKTLNYELIVDNMIDKFKTIDFWWIHLLYNHLDLFPWQGNNFIIFIIKLALLFDFYL